MFSVVAMGPTQIEVRERERQGRKVRDLPAYLMYLANLSVT